MRRLLLTVTLVSAALSPATSHATEGPWCAVLNFGGMGPAEKCNMPSFEACQQLAMQYGTASFCRQNPGWPGYYRPQGLHQPSPAYRKKRSHDH